MANEQAPVPVRDTTAHVPRTHHLDRRADDLAQKGAGDPDDLLREIMVAAWLGVSMQWLQIGRHSGYGPPFIKIGRLVRYRRADVLAWLNGRLHHSTAEYSRDQAPAEV